MKKIIIGQYFYPVIVSISSIAVLNISINLISISKSLSKLSESNEQINEWAKSQNECITKTFRLNGKNTQGIPSKVWSCNGGGN